MKDLNLIRVQVKCRAVPSISTQEQIRSALRALILSLDDRAILGERSSSGSWWAECWGYVAAGCAWVLLQSASWGVKKALDSAAGKLTGDNDCEVGAIPPEGQAALSELSSSESTPSWMSPVALRKEDFLTSSVSFMIKHNIDQLTVGELLPELSLSEADVPIFRGRVLMIEIREGKVSPKLIVTSNKEDFDSYFVSRV